MHTSVHMFDAELTLDKGIYDTFFYFLYLNLDEKPKVPEELPAEVLWKFELELWMRVRRISLVLDGDTKMHLETMANPDDLNAATLLAHIENCVDPRPRPDITDGRVVKLSKTVLKLAAPSIDFEESGRPAERCFVCQKFELEFKSEELLSGEQGAMAPHKKRNLIEISGMGSVRMLLAPFLRHAGALMLFSQMDAVMLRLAKQNHLDADDPATMMVLRVSDMRDAIIVVQPTVGQPGLWIEVEMPLAEMTMGVLTTDLELRLGVHIRSVNQVNSDLLPGVVSLPSMGHFVGRACPVMSRSALHIVYKPGQQLTFEVNPGNEGVGSQDLSLLIDETVCRLGEALLKSLSAMQVKLAHAALATFDAVEALGLERLPPPEAYPAPDRGPLMINIGLRCINLMYCSSLDRQSVMLSLNMTIVTLDSRVPEETTCVVEVDVSVRERPQVRPNERLLLASIFEPLASPKVQLVLNTEDGFFADVSIGPVDVAMTGSMTESLGLALQGVGRLMPRSTAISRDDATALEAAARLTRATPPAPTDQVTRYSFNMSSFSVSLFMADQDDTDELCLLSVADVSAVMMSENSVKPVVTIVCDVGGLQIDNMNPKAEDPCAFAQHPGFSKRQMSAAEQAIRSSIKRDPDAVSDDEISKAFFSVVWKTTAGDSVSRKENELFVAVMPMVVALDEGMLSGLVRHVNSLMGRTPQDPTEDDQDSRQDEESGGNSEHSQPDESIQVVVSNSEDSTEADLVDKLDEAGVLVNWRVTIAPMEVHLALRLSPAARLPWGELLPSLDFLGSLLGSLAHIDGVPLEVPGMTLEADATVLEVVVAQVTTHLREAIFSSSGQLIGSVGILGHPTISAHHAAVGISEFMKGATFQNQTPLGGTGALLTRGLSAMITPFAAVPVGAGKFLAIASQDHTYRVFREQLLKSSTESSLSASLRLLGYSLVRPFGIFYEGCASLSQGEYMDGLLSIGRSLIGAAVLPVAGLTDAITVWTRGYDILLMPSNLLPRRFLHIKQPGELRLHRARSCFWAFVFYNLIDRVDKEVFEGQIENRDKACVLMWSNQRVVLVRFDTSFVSESDSDLPKPPSRSGRIRFMARFKLEYNIERASLVDQKRLPDGPSLRFVYRQACQDQVLLFGLPSQADNMPNIVEHLKKL